MGNRLYKKPEPVDVRGVCVVCEKNPQKRVKKDKYQALCSGCDIRRFNSDSRVYHKSKKTYCEKCGFVPEHQCQLDVDHIDGNHHNNDPINWQTLCANCHRLKTYSQRWQ